jgi:hypothetical protein
MILRDSLRLGTLAIIVWLAILSNAQVVEKTDFEHAPRKFFYFDDSSVCPLSVLTIGDIIPRPRDSASLR